MPPKQSSTEWKSTKHISSISINRRSPPLLTRNFVQLPDPFHVHAPVTHARSQNVFSLFFDKFDKECGCTGSLVLHSSTTVHHASIDRFALHSVHCIRRYLISKKVKGCRTSFASSFDIPFQPMASNHPFFLPTHVSFFSTNRSAALVNICSKQLFETERPPASWITWRTSTLLHFPTFKRLTSGPSKNPCRWCFIKGWCASISTGLSHATSLQLVARRETNFEII